MFRDILVPVDLIDKNKEAIQTAVELASASDGIVRLLHVIQTIPHVDEQQDTDFYDELREKATAVLDDWRSEFESVQGDIRCEVIRGSRVEEIISYAEDKRCDLIVMSTHRLDPEKVGKGLGTISHQVTLFGNCPVLLLR
jgi:nucleotide-binding universal stress UspA family protein